ncbi:DUF5995 family protein [Actinoplanes sp. NPDC089786]|uniref:DUF5995 family protein n=1 Tax=Actinoplanes sp. NPDC089786 TaxID=3155185 RepID=UPI00343AE920
MTESVWGTADERMRALLGRLPADVPAVVDQLTKLQDALERVPPLLAGNPLADFNKLYLNITLDVLARLSEKRFEDPAFISRLDVEFSGRYFDALRGFTDGGAGCPRTWQVLFARVAGPDARPLPSAAAGANAHINFDLAFALVSTFDQAGPGPADDSAQHRDYLQINKIFADAIPQLRRGYLDKWQLLVDTMNGELDDWWQGEAIAYTRNVAWRNAQKLWTLRSDVQATARFRDTLDETTAALGRLLLSPMGELLQ